MNKRSLEFLDFVDKELDHTKLNYNNWLIYLHNLPYIYRKDINFRLSLNWHFLRKMGCGNAAYSMSNVVMEDKIFMKQVELIWGIASNHKLSYQYPELVLYHAKVDLHKKKVLEIGGNWPNNILFEEFRMDEYINIESPDYLESQEDEDIGERYNYGSHPKKETIICNIEDLGDKIKANTIDNILSICSFEHIYNLEETLNYCHKILRKQGILYAYFQPIYSDLKEGDHGTIPEHSVFKEKPIGFHLLSPRDQRRKLTESGMKSPQEIQDFLGNVHFNRCPNRLKYEDYERIITESPLWVLDYERFDEYNLYKQHKAIIDEIRNSNQKTGNIMTKGFRIQLIKI